MLKSQRSTSIALLMALDALALLLAFVLVWQLRGSLGEFVLTTAKTLGYDTGSWVRSVKNAAKSQDIRSIILSPNPLVNVRNHLWVVYFSLLAWGAFLFWQKGYDLTIRRTSRQEFAVCAYSGLLGTVALLAFMGAARWETSRLFLVGLLLIGTIFLWLERAFLAPAVLRGARRAVRHVLLIGPAQSAERFAAMLQTPAFQWSHLVGFVSDEPGEVAGVAKLGSLADLPRILHSQVIDEVILVRAGSQNDTHLNWGGMLELCLEQGRTVSLVDDIAPPVGAKVEAGMMGQMPVLMLHNTPQNSLALAVKNVMDRMVAAVMLLILVFVVPVFPIVALLIKLHDRGPVFFNQERVGLNGRVFKFYKFRSMHINAQEILEKMKREDRVRYDSINLMEDPFFKAKDGDDPRITPIGRFIRKYSIDELPQFFNVLKGDMSLVGPRPPLPKEVAELQPWHRRKLSVKGGLTCIWQATGRNDISEVDDWMKLDLEYIDNWSLWLDVKLLFKTLKVLVKPRGAS